MAVNRRMFLAGGLGLAFSAIRPTSASSDDGGEADRRVFVTDADGHPADVIRRLARDRVSATAAEEAGDADLWVLLSPPPDGDVVTRFVDDGGSVLAVAGAGTGGDAAWQALLGARPVEQGWPPRAPVPLKGQDMTHPAVRPVGGQRTVRSSLWRFADYDVDAVRTLMSLDMRRTYLRRAEHVPVVWCRQFGAGLLLYSNLGFDDATWREDWFERHLAGALAFLTRREPGETAPNPIVARREEAFAQQAFEDASPGPRRPGPPSAPGVGGSQEPPVGAPQ